ncbi:hypothetical protein OSTOST_02791 [Ostertagia ostertagi]
MPMFSRDINTTSVAAPPGRSISIPRTTHLQKFDRATRRTDEENPGYPDYDKPFHIFTDASTVAQAGDLMQEEQVGSNKFYAIAYCSRTLTRDGTSLARCPNRARRHHLRPQAVQTVYLYGADQGSVAAPEQELQDIIDFPVSLQVITNKTAPLAPVRSTRTYIRDCPELIDFPQEQQQDGFLRVVWLLASDQPLQSTVTDEVRARAQSVADRVHITPDGCMYYRLTKASNDKPLLLVPQKFQSLLFSAHHSSALGGHTGWKKDPCQRYCANTTGPLYTPTCASGVRNASPVR